MDKPNYCPFCNRPHTVSVNEIEKHIPFDEDTYCYTIHCRSCGITTSIFNTEDELLKYWNHRPAEDALKAENEALLRYVAQLTARLKVMEDAYEEIFKKHIPEKIVVIK